MAGDHKCPVCSSTFTRPQHVARHMRSHTGDRPYKCQHCGDQFARSDLLSRHVNKCHASEKPATTTQPKRRGHAAPGSSATGVRGPAPPLIPPPGTRKICDFCATSRTPAQCDSGLPCGKCLQRNSKCTYIKAEAAARRPGLVGLGVTPDLFAPPTTVPSMAPPRADLFPPQASFNFSVPATALYSSTASTLDPTAAAAPSSYAYDPSGNQGLSALQSSSAFNHHTQYATPLNHNQSTAPSSFASQQQAAAGNLADARKSALDAYLDSAFPPPSHQAVPGGAYGGMYAGGNGVSGLNNAGSAHASQQQPLQPPPAPAMPVHTQIDFASFARQQRQAQQQSQQGQQQHDSNQGSPVLPQQQVPGQGSPVQTSSNLGDPGVSNAFGLMSLDDPALSTEMSKGNSFFAPGALPSGFSTGLTPRKDRSDFLSMFPSSSASASNTQPATTAGGIGPTTASLLTPGLGLGLSSASGGGLFGLGGTGLTPALNASSSLFGPGGNFGLNTPTKDANIAELKDFWKAFMKTPGEKTPGAGMLGGADDNRPSTANSSTTTGTGNHRPLGKMASLPDIKTPGGGSALGHLVYNVQGQKDAATKQNFSGKEDLRSYEMAVLARQAPNLRLVPKRRTGSMSMHPPSSSQSPQLGHHYSGSMSTVSPPSLDSNASSPTSNASGSSGTPAPAVSRLVRSDRPSFKRLASSTLQPFESKSVKTSHHGLVDGEEDGEAEWADGLEDVQQHGGHRTTDVKGHVRSPSSEYPPGYQSQHQSHGRRMSAPSGTAPVVI